MPWPQGLPSAAHREKQSLLPPPTKLSQKVPETGQPPRRPTETALAPRSRPQPPLGRPRTHGRWTAVMSRSRRLPWPSAS